MNQIDTQAERASKSQPMVSSTPQKLAQEWDGAQAEELYRVAIQSTKHVKEMIDLAPMPVVCTSSKGIVVQWNPEAEKVFGWTEAEVLGRVSPSVSEDQYEEALGLYYQLISGKPVSGLETRRIRKDGSYVYIRIYGIPLYGDDRQIVGFMFTLFDMTVERQTRLAREQAENARNLLIANVSHELRTPIAAILGATEYLKIDGSSKRAEQFVQIIKRSGDHLLCLVDDLLDLAKLEANQLKIDLILFSLQDLLQEVKASLLCEADKKRIQLQLSVSTSLPSLIKSDPLRVKQVLLNLLGNALKFTDIGEVIVRVGFIATERAIRIDISDTGGGIELELQPQIFRSFVRGYPRKSGPRPVGSGLGLALSKGLANALGGDVQLLKSEFNVGSTFRFLLRDHQLVGPAQAGDIVTSKLLVMNSDALKGVRILFAEDSPDISDLYQTLLSHYGAQVELSSDGEGAIAKALAGDYDIVLMDIEMPVLNGLEATKRLKSAGYDRPIVALTAHALGEERARCLEFGCEDYFVKPMPIDLLASSILSIIRRK